MDEKTRLSYYKKSLQSAWGYNDYNDWPVKVNSVMHIFLPDFAAEFLADLDEIKSQNIPVKEIAAAFGNPARFYRLIDPVIFGMKRLKIDIFKQRKIVLYLLDIVKEMKYGSEFNEEGVNVICSPDQITELQKRISFNKADRESSTIIHRFCGVMWAYTESILFRAHEVTKEIHGPYAIDEQQEKFIIREYLNLKPTAIWGDIPFIPYSKIVVYAKYQNTLDVTIDSYNHLFLHRGNYVNDITEYVVEADGKEFAVQKLMTIIPDIQKTIKFVHDWVTEASWHKRVNRYADIYWYRKSPLKKLLGKNWQVPKAVREKINKGNADEKRLVNLSDESIDRLIRIVI